jgi:hypothetical protein
VARRLELTALAVRRHSTVEQAARALGIARYGVRGRLRLRRALLAFGPYRYSSCT